ncbi:MAG: CBS domain-containing protein [Phycisphaerae bacterium]|nr:CBS domain-containing protein [Phycisphaerae bacterium]
MSDRRTRRKPDPEDFQDPLSDYDRPGFADELERSLSEDSATAIESRPFSQVPPGTPLRDVLRKMADEDIACIVITENERPIGILSERDVLKRVAGRYDKIADQPVSGVMTPDPVVLYETDNPARALNVMGSGLFRHLPLVDADGKLVGVIGARRVTAYLQKHFDPISAD